MLLRLQSYGGQSFVRPTVVRASNDIHPTEGGERSTLLEKNSPFVDDEADRFSRQNYLQSKQC